MSFANAEADRRLANVIQIGTVCEVAHGASRARVQIGDLKTALIPVSQIRSGAIKLHWMPSVGEQVSVLAPSGDLARAFIMGSLPIDGNAVAPDGGTPTMDLGGGTLRVVGNLHVSGDVIVGGDVVASGISLTKHTHGGVKAGGDQTGGPA